MKQTLINTATFEVHDICSNARLTDWITSYLTTIPVTLQPKYIKILFEI